MATPVPNARIGLSISHCFVNNIDTFSSIDPNIGALHCVDRHDNFIALIPVGKVKKKEELYKLKKHIKLVQLSTTTWLFLKVKHTVTIKCLIIFDMVWVTKHIITPNKIFHNSYFKFSIELRVGLCGEHKTT